MVFYIGASGILGFDFFVLGGTYPYLPLMLASVQCIVQSVFAWKFAASAEERAFVREFGVWAYLRAGIRRILTGNLDALHAEPDDEPNAATGGG